MQENIVKRYLLEQGYEVGNYYRKLDKKRVNNEDEYIDKLMEKVNKGEIVINPLKFQMWYKKLCQDRKTFIRYLQSVGFLNENQQIVEFTESEKIPSIMGTQFHLDVTKVIMPLGNPIQLDTTFKPVKGCLVINGLYKGELPYIKESIKNKNPFLIGYCGDITSEYTHHVIQQYKKLKTELLLAGVTDLEQIEDTLQNSKKVYVLNYNNQPTFKQVDYVSKKHSER